MNIYLRLRVLRIVSITVLAMLIAGCGGSHLKDQGSSQGPSASVAPTTAAPVRADGESDEAFEARVRAEADRLSRMSREQAERDAQVAIAKIKADAKVAAERAKGEARNDFLAGVRTWTGWAMGVLVFVGLAALVLSFLPWTTAIGFDAKDSAKAFGFAAALSLGRYIMLRYGLAVGDVAAWVLIAALVVSAIITGLMVGKALLRSKLLTQAKILEAKDETRPAVALMAVAKGKTGEGVLDKQWRKAKAKP